MFSRLFVWVCLVSVSALGQEVPSLPLLKQMLDSSQRRSQLVANDGSPFHLVASFEWFDGKGSSLGKGTLDELWENPRRYRQQLILPNGGFIEVDNGKQAWRTGKFSEPQEVGLGVDATLQPFIERPITSNRVVYESERSVKAGFDCIGTEPDLPGVSDQVALAQTTYCLEKGNHLLRRIDRPNYFSIAFNDIRPFGNKFVAREIDVAQLGQVILHMRIDVLVEANEFSALDVAIPADAQMLNIHRADVPYRTTEIMRGQILKTSGPMETGTGRRGLVAIKVHIDTAGNVESAEVVSAENKPLIAPALASIKQWKFRASYQGQALVPVDEIVEMNLGEQRR